MATTRITKRAVEAEAPSEKPVFLWDDQLSGFGVKVLPTGQRRYVVKYRAGAGGRDAQQRWLTLGTHGVITADQARAMATQALAAVARGEDPQASRLTARAAPTMADLWTRYEAEHLPRKKLSSQRDDLQKWRGIIGPILARRKVGEISRDDVASLHRRLAETPYQANRALALLSKLFNLAELWGMRPDNTNPCRHVRKFPEQHRERYLTSEELARLGNALRAGLAAQTETPYMVAAIQLLLLTGARLSEILTAQWSWVNWSSRIIQLPDSKTGRKPLFLSEPAINVLREVQALPTSKDSPYIIRGRSKDQPLINLAKPWKRICERAGLSDVRLHDLRHTAASVGVAQGMSLPVVGRLLGHTQASTTNRYAHVDIDPALAAANLIGNAIYSAMETIKHPDDDEAPFGAHPPD
ncbi:tyrosine-type recombinase/integrase [Azospirillum rugosum]|uniref:Integrase n=1 Tax=Azospirillum rugosum TaxID=416170 RepID=A0ABS4SJI8_9PROT|nr:site-specific integrase [Azospirillum rugosum]MBP2292238.1 integrase [Azospirillum rugosum]MDQ0525997.1 integrase [Azospirillum rugosum]